MWRVFEQRTGEWRGLAEIPAGCLDLAPAYADWNARERFDVEPAAATVDPLTEQCRCGDIMAGKASPDDCPLFGGACVPSDPVGACMVSSEGTCKIWYEYGGHPDL
jgi:hydrogenase expression/formation protein HypD